MTLEEAVIKHRLLAQMLRNAGTKRATFYSRKARGHSFMACLTGEGIPPVGKPTRQGKRRKGIAAECERHGVPLQTYYSRIDRGYTHWQALTGIGIKPAGRPRSKP